MKILVFQKLEQQKFEIFVFQDVRQNKMKKTVFQKLSKKIEFLEKQNFASFFVFFSEFQNVE